MVLKSERCPVTKGQRQVATGPGEESAEEWEVDYSPVVQNNLIDTQETSVSVTFNVFHSIKLIFQRD